MLRTHPKNCQCAGCRAKRGDNTFLGKHHSLKTRKILSDLAKKRIGELASNYRGGKPKCIDCGKELSRKNAIRCKKHENINRKTSNIFHNEDFINKISKISTNNWKNLEYRNKTTKNILKGLRLHPNKPETVLKNLLNILFPKQYKFVGDGKVILGGFCPDFINCNGQKKIIELYGDYWHNRTDYKVRDKRRLMAYGDLGYKTLIIWQYELKDIKTLTTELINFNKGE